MQKFNLEEALKKYILKTLLKDLKNALKPKPVNAELVTDKETLEKIFFAKEIKNDSRNSDHTNSTHTTQQQKVKRKKNSKHIE